MTGISNEDVADAPALVAVAPELLAFVGSDVAAVMAHNANFDIGFLRSAGIQFHRPVYDTLELAGILAPGLPSYSLGELCHTFGITIDAAHHALDDAAASAEVFVTLQERARNLPVATLRAIVASAEHTDWPYTRFFADALATMQQAAGTQPAPEPQESPEPSALRTGRLPRSWGRPMNCATARWRWRAR
jgi:DNA polymerase III epsilon subunit-like protein